MIYQINGENIILRYMRNNNFTRELSSFCYGDIKNI